MSKIDKFFRDIKNPALRAWNQVHFARNMSESITEGAAEAYYESLSDEEKVNVMIIATRIFAKGEDFVRNEVVNYKE